MQDRTDQPPGVGESEPGTRPETGEAEVGPASASGATVSGRWGKLRIAGLTALVAAIVLILVLLIAGGDDEDTAVTPGEPRIVSVDELQAFAEQLGHEVYWAGERPGTELELTETEGGDVYIRYLTEGAEAGDPAADFLTIGTYPVEDAVGSLETIAQEPGAIKQRAPDGRLLVTKRSELTSVYLAEPGSELQVEVYDPDTQVPLELALSGAVVPVP